MFLCMCACVYDSEDLFGYVCVYMCAHMSMYRRAHIWVCVSMCVWIPLPPFLLSCAWESHLWACCPECPHPHGSRESRGPHSGSEVQSRAGPAVCLEAVLPCLRATGQTQPHAEGAPVSPGLPGAPTCPLRRPRRLTAGSTNVKDAVCTQQAYPRFLRRPKVTWSDSICLKHPSKGAQPALEGRLALGFPQCMALDP